MTSHMISFTRSVHDNAHRGEDLDTRRARAKASFAEALSDLQHLVSQLVAAGATRAEISHTPAFRLGVRRARAFRGELILTRP